MRKIGFFSWIFLLGAFVLLIEPTAFQHAPDEKSEMTRIIRCNFFDMRSFKASFDGIDQDGGALTVKNSDSDEETRIAGGIVPHHLVAAPMIARFFNEMREENPETIVILAPNHKRVGDRTLHTGSFSWDTPFGNLDADEEIIEKIIKNFGAGVNPNLLAGEHSIAALIPYVRYTFPEASIVPVLIHGNMERRDCARLSAFFANEAMEKSLLIIASVDFSHHLEPKAAYRNDEITQKAIEARDYDTLFRLDNTYLDAPPTLSAVLMTMDLLGNAEEKAVKEKENIDKGVHDVILEHGEASMFLNRHVPDTTSYFTYIFIR